MSLLKLESQTVSQLHAAACIRGLDSTRGGSVSARVLEGHTTVGRALHSEGQVLRLENLMLPVLRELGGSRDLPLEISSDFLNRDAEAASPARAVDQSRP